MRQLAAAPAEQAPPEESESKLPHSKKPISWPVPGVGAAEQGGACRNALPHLPQQNHRPDPSFRVSEAEFSESSVGSGCAPFPKRVELEFEDLGQKPTTQRDLAKLKDELLGAIHDSETRLLTAIYAYAEAAQKHFLDLDRSDASFRERLGSLEGRVTEIEKRLNMPPAS